MVAAGSSRVLTAAVSQRSLAQIPAWLTTKGWWLFIKCTLCPRQLQCYISLSWVEVKASPVPWSRNQQENPLTVHFIDRKKRLNSIPQKIKCESKFASAGIIMTVKQSHSYFQEKKNTSCQSCKRKRANPVGKVGLRERVQVSSISLSESYKAGSSNIKSKNNKQQLPT